MIEGRGPDREIGKYTKVLMQMNIRGSARKADQKGSYSFEMIILAGRETADIPKQLS